MRILLTGSTGYLGLHVLRELLARGHEVTAAVRDPGRLGPFGDDPRVRVWVADWEDGAGVVRALRGHEGLVHAALLWGPEGTELRDTAVAAQLFDAAGVSGVSRMVFVSSAAVMRGRSGVASEDDALAPADLYGATKGAGELFLRATCTLYGGVGVVVRPGPIVGPPAYPGARFRSDRRLITMVEAARGGRPIGVPCGEGRQWSDVSAVAETIGRVLVERCPHATYHCMDPERVPWMTAALSVIAETGSPSALVPEEPLAGATFGPRFRTDRVEVLLGGPPSAVEGLRAHIRHLVATAG